MNNLKLVETDVFNEIATCDFGVTPTMSILSQENRLVEHWVIKIQVKQLKRFT